MENTQKTGIVGISAISYSVPSTVLTSLELEKKINKDSKKEIISAGIIEKITGVKQRHIVGKEQYNSTLAARACKNLFTEYCIAPNTIDLLIFAATGQDILEPATAHIIQKEIGTTCPVLDVKNACNSFLNALEIATAFIALGKYQSILIATGEVPSTAAKTILKDRAELTESLPAYIFGDAGVAVLVDQHAKIATIKDSYFFAESDNWDIATFPGGGSRHRNEKNAYFFQSNGAKLVKPFFVHTKKLLSTFLEKNNIILIEIDHFFVHQVTLSYLKKLCVVLEIPEDKITPTLVNYGNVAAATLPLALKKGFITRSPKPGSYGLLIGLAGGISIGFTLLKF